MEIYALLVEKGFEEKVSASLKQPASQQYLSKKEDQKILTIPGHIFVRLKYTRKTLSFLKTIAGIEGFFLQTHENEAIDKMKYYELAAFKDKDSAKSSSVKTAGKSAKVTPKSATHTKGFAYSIDLSFDRGDYTLEKISDGARGLRPNIDYTIKNSSCSILPSYLDRKRVGTFTLTFHMSGGFNPTVILEIKKGNAKVLPTRVNYEIGSEVTPKLTLMPNGRRLAELNDGTNTLKLNVHYTVQGNVFMLKKSYLDHIATYLSGVDEDQIALTFKMDGGTNPSVSIRIAEGGASVKPTAAAYKMGSNEPLSFTLIANENKFLGLEVEKERVAKSENTYSLSGNNLTIKPSYLESLGEKLLQKGAESTGLTFVMDGARSPEAKLHIMHGEPVLAPVNAIYTKGSGEDIVFKLQTGGRKLISLKDGAKELVKNGDYIVSDSEFKILSSYFEKREDDDLLKLTFVLDSGSSPVASVQIRPATKTVKEETPFISAEPSEETAETQERPLSKPPEKPGPGQPADPQEEEKKKDSIEKEEEEEESLDFLIRGKKPLTEDINVFGDSLQKKKIDVISFIKDRFFHIPAALFIIALLLIGGGFIYIYFDYLALKETEPIIYYENDNEWSGWQGMDETIAEGTLSINRQIYYAPHAMYYFTLDQVPQINAAIKMNTRVKGFTSRVYSIVTLFFPGGNVSLVTDKDYRLGLMSGPQGDITYSDKGALSDELHDLYLFLDEPNGEISVYVDGNRVLSKERDFIVYPLQEVWIGSVWVGGGNDLGVGLGHDVKSFILSDESIILANYTYGETLRQNLREKEWLQLLPLIAILLIVVVVAWNIFLRIQTKKQT